LEEKDQASTELERIKYCYYTDCKDDCSYDCSCDYICNHSNKTLSNNDKDELLQADRPIEMENNQSADFLDLNVKPTTQIYDEKSCSSSSSIENIF
jgi:hypothetical protein